jgi:hypothetical protein
MSVRLNFTLRSSICPRAPGHSWPALTIFIRLECVAAIAQALQIGIVKPALRRYWNRNDVIHHISSHNQPSDTAMPAQRLIHQMLQPDALPLAVVTAGTRSAAESIVSLRVG